MRIVLTEPDDVRIRFEAACYRIGEGAAQAGLLAGPQQGGAESLYRPSPGARRAVVHPARRGDRGHEVQSLDPGDALVLAWGRDWPDLEAARIENCRHTAYRPALSGRVPTFKNYRGRIARLEIGLLYLSKPFLDPSKVTEIDTLV